MTDGHMTDRPATSAARWTRTMASGFTLIELMVTVAVAAIITTIAVASYNQEVVKSRRTDAKTALLDLAGREERYYSLNNAYTAVASDLGYSAFGAGTTVGSGYYQLNAPVVTAATATAPAAFTLTAVPVGAQQANDTSCQTFTVLSTGQQSSTDGSGNDTTSTCWQ